MMLMLTRKGFTLIEVILSCLAIALLAIGVSGLLSCGGCKQWSAKNFGGTQIINLPQGAKFVNCTWKDSNLWVLTEQRSESEKPKTYRFSEKSVYGVLQGEVVINEK